MSAQLLPFQAAFIESTTGIMEQLRMAEQLPIIPGDINLDSLFERLYAVRRERRRNGDDPLYFNQQLLGTWEREIDHCSFQPRPDPDGAVAAGFGHIPHRIEGTAVREPITKDSIARIFAVDEPKTRKELLDRHAEALMERLAAAGKPAHEIKEWLESMGFSKTPQP
jgi:hypothetical protein